jgi:UDP-N-acetylglucosamine 2-epimerase (non-hydrolysing)/GDP/UDP-N,N'-diacetylbacillosamine 2-epimerase (hydrolysing)
MNKDKRKICFITGTRADFGIYSPVIRAVSDSKKLEAYIVATGMHLLPEFGNTYKEIEKEGFKIYEKVNIAYEGDTGKEMAESVGKAILGFTKTFAELKPQIVAVLGDRGEMLAAAVAANYQNIPVAHIHGGEVSGHVDGLLRHAITKLSHIHFAATKQAQERIIRLGEEPWRVTVSGAPALDRILKEKLPSKDELLKKYNLDRNKPIIILAEHPVLAESTEAGKQIEISLKAVTGFDVEIIVIYPNSDAGGKRMIKVINHCKNNKLKIVKSLPHKDFLGLLKIATVMVGNSSSGIIEAPSFKLPVVNVGSRQEGREHGRNVIDVGYSVDEIKRAINKIISCDKIFEKKLKGCNNPYGDGKASEKIVRTLETIKIDGKLINKKITY